MRFIQFVLIGLLSVSFAFASDKNQKVLLNKPNVLSQKVIDIGNVGIHVTNAGYFGDWHLQASYEKPIGSSNYHLYYGTIVFAARVNEQIVAIANKSSTSRFEWGDLTSPDTIEMRYGEDALSDLDTYCRFDDNSPYNETVIGIQVTQKTYSYANVIFGDFIVYDLSFKNISVDNFIDSYIGFHMDADISSVGDAGESYEFKHFIDDMVGFDAGNNISFIYDNDNPNIPGDDTGGENGEESGYFGQMALHADENEYGQEDVPTSHSWWDWNNDPETDQVYYDHMTAGIVAPPPSPHDFRYLQSFGPYDILPGDSVNIIVAIAVGEEFNGLEYALLRAREVYENGFAPVQDPQPFAPTDVTLVNMYPTPLLIWEPSPEPDLDHYNIYANDALMASVDGSETTYQLPALLKNKAPAADATDVRSPSIHAPGDLYQFDISVVWSDGTEGDRSEPASIVSGTPTTVRGLGADPQDGQVMLSWSANPEGNITGYNIYRDNVFVTNTVNNSFLDSELTNWQRYGYQVTAINTNALESERTQPLYVVPNPRQANKILLVDHSAATDEKIKYFYQRYVVYGYDYDYWNLTSQGSIPTEVLNNYSSIIWLTDINFGQPFDLFFLTNQGADQALRTFLDGGGNLWLSGSYILDYIYDDYKPLPGSFEYDYLKLLNWAGVYYTDLVGADTPFPDMTIDVGKDPDQYKLAYILNDPDSLLEYQTTEMYRFGPRCSANFQDKTSAIFYDGEVFNTAVTGFPLYYMPGSGIMQVGRYLLTDLFGESYLSDPPPVTPIDITLLDWTETTIDIRWQRGDEDDLFGYNVYKATSAEGTYIKDNSQIINQTESEYTLQNLTQGMEYFIKVSAVDLTQQESQLSDYVHEIPGRPVAVQNLRWTTINELGIATIEWDASQEADVIRYNIYIDSVKSASTSNAEYQINVKDMLVRVYVTAEDNLSIESYPSNQINVSNIEATEDLLVVNGISYNIYATEMTNFYTAAACIGSHTAHIWDLFGNQGVNYTELNAQFEEQYLEGGAIPDTFLFKYHKVIWIGNNYQGDLDYFSQQQVMDYLKQGGNFLLATRMGNDFLSGDLQSYLGILTIYPSNTIDTMYPLLAQDIHLVNMGPGNGSTSSTGTDLVRFNQEDNVSVLFHWDGSGSPQVAGFRRLVYRQGEFIYIAGRPYRFDLTASYNNYDYIIGNWLNGPATGIKNTGKGKIPKEFSLSQNYPNPFNPQTIVSFGLPRKSDIRLIFYNLLGQKVRIFERTFDAGYHQILWNGTNQSGQQVASGLYIYRFEADDFSAVRKCILLR
jgi:fibronectin type 3 domain-containing protein